MTTSDSRRGRGHTVPVSALTHPYLRGPYPRAFVHRGWRLGELAGLENSLSACARAFAEGFAYLEIDVRATADGQVLVHHDASLDRVTDATGVIAELPYAAVAGARIAGREPVCRLVDLIEELPGAYLNIDVKDDATVLPTIGVLRRTGHWDRVCLAAFSDRRLAALRRLGGDRLLTSMGPRSALWWWASARLPGVGRLARGWAAQVPVTRHGLTVVTDRTVGAARRLGREVHVWTVNEVAEMRRLLDLGVDGLVTDRPDLLRDVLRERGRWGVH